MQVFTTVFLAETVPADFEGVEEMSAHDLHQHAVDEFKRLFRERIAVLESHDPLEE